MDRILLLVLALLALPARAQTIYKCTSPKGDNVYQSFPCAGDKPAEKQWRAEQPIITQEEYAQRVAAERKIERDRQHMRSRSTQVGRSQATPVGAEVTSRDKNGCEAAKANRAGTLEAAGLNRTFQLLRQMDDVVWRACN